MNHPYRVTLTKGEFHATLDVDAWSPVAAISEALTESWSWGWNYFPFEVSAKVELR